MRLFIALPLQAETRAALRQVLEELQKAAPSVRWVRADQVHLTLRFLGETDRSRVAALQKVIDEIAARGSVLELHLDQFGGFPNLQRPRVIWIGSTDRRAIEQLGNMARDLETALRKLGFAAETKAFKPHLTLGRLKHPANLGNLVEIVREGRLPELRASLTHIGLIQSTLTPQGAIHQTLHEAPLGATGHSTE